MIKEVVESCMGKRSNIDSSFENESHHEYRVIDDKVNLLMLDD